MIITRHRSSSLFFLQRFPFTFNVKKKASTVQPPGGAVGGVGPPGINVGGVGSSASVGGALEGSGPATGLVGAAAGFSHSKGTNHEVI
jgi:hypothetical protein